MVSSAHAVGRGLNKLRGIFVKQLVNNTIKPEKACFLAKPTVVRMRTCVRVSARFSSRPKRRKTDGSDVNGRTKDPLCSPGGGSDVLCRGLVAMQVQAAAAKVGTESTCRVCGSYRGTPSVCQ